uniref:MULE transposase domain-containing protein n=1 Tax=Trichogramma kaykai TaxID=54128 RepID=A0ABD2WBQ2_9HYME
MGFEEKMRAARSKYVPPIPRNLKKLGSMLEEYKPMKGLFRGMVKGDKKEVALIFIHDDMIEPLNECCHLYMDGTFSMRSLIPGFRQIYIIHFRKLDAVRILNNVENFKKVINYNSTIKGFASIFVFLSSQTKTMYDVMWRGIFELVPKLKVNVTTIMCDFERAQIASLKENFDKVDICGCLFHYKSVTKPAPLRTRARDNTKRRSSRLARANEQTIDTCISEQQGTEQSGEYASPC